MTRDEWKSRSREFERSASALLASSRYDVAYHIAGIAVECALKAKISTLFRANDVPDKKLVEDFYRDGHDLVRLVRLAQLEGLLAAEEQVHPAFRANWATVRAWSINSRYNAWSPVEATDMVRAVAQRGTGVLSWLKHHW
jgi:HEPN domain-containing protein